jgi:preprotein translocase subunit SecA
LIPGLTPAETPEEGSDVIPEGDFTIDEKQKQVYLTEDGMARVEQLMVSAGLLKADDSLYNAQNLNLVHHLNAGLRAHHLFHKDVEYIIKDNEIVIVDEFTGRTLTGRRWSDGLHQAVEAKEGVPIQRENQTLASITFQNYFRLYNKLSGMTGTADTEAYEFQSIYGLEVVVIPTHRPMIRVDNDDLVFLKSEGKFKAIVDDIKDCVKRGQPVLVGTTSIETSELISKRLKKDKIRHEVLNAKQHQREAQIVAQAGRTSAVTIATNMAGRGTDIVLGGNLNAELIELGEDASEEKKEKLKEDWQERHNNVLEAGGLHIIGTERHESRRIDNQLRGRSGRQGDPGSSRFYLSLEDNLMRIFASDRMSSMMQRFGMKEDEAIEAGMLNRAIENAQRKVEAHNFDVRKHLLEYDDVANDQRRVVYGQRNDLMEDEDVHDAILEFRANVFSNLVNQYMPEGSIDEQWDVPGLEKALDGEFGIKVPIHDWLEADEQLTEADVNQRISEVVTEHFDAKEAETGPEVMRHFEKALMLKQPMQEYKRESFEMFSALLENIQHEVVRILARVQVREPEDVEAVETKRQQQDEIEYRHEQSSAIPGGQGGQAAPDAPFVREGRKVGRNEACPCGSGKKYKHCHGQLT